MQKNIYKIGLSTLTFKKGKNNYIKYTALKRMANKKDLEGIINYLLSDSSNYMTGQNLIIDGGWTLK